MKIAVLLATFNRKEKTLACLTSLFEQQLSKGIQLAVYLTDDASTDGTADAVKRKFPQVNILMGSGSLFWAGGMRNTWRAALNCNADCFLLLNDDTILESTAIDQLIFCNEQFADKGNVICIGTTRDTISGNISYGGHKLIHPQKVQYQSIFSATEYLECDMANANIMFVPAKVVQEIGILSDAYTHSIADFDYTIRATRSGIKVIVVPGILGFCTDDHGKSWKSSDTSLKDRVKYLKSPKGLAYKEYLHFIRLYFPKHLPEAFFKLWLKTLFPVLWDKLKK